MKWYYLLQWLFTLCSDHILLQWLHCVPTHKLSNGIWFTKKKQKTFKLDVGYCESYTSVYLKPHLTVHTRAKTSYRVIRIVHGHEIWGRSTALKNTVVFWFLKEKKRWPKIQRSLWWNARGPVCNWENLPKGQKLLQNSTNEAFTAEWPDT